MATDTREPREAEEAWEGKAGEGGEDPLARGRGEIMPILERQVGSLALSELEGVGSMALMRAVAWHNVLARLGIAVPLVVVHDVGCLLCGLGRPAQVVQGIGDSRLGEAWRQLLIELAETELVRHAAAWKHRDPMVGVVLARILHSVAPQLPEEARVARPRELPVDVVQYARVDPRSAYTRYDQELALAWLRTMCTHRLLPLLETEQIDVDALRLLGLFRSGGTGVAGVDLADLYNVILSPQLADVIDFSLELLPSLLEVRREMGQQTFGVDGYASIERIGHIDNMVLSQLAYDDEIFEQKFVDRELFYYTHQKQYDNERRQHWVLVDGSASMRGVREVFARGLALALCKRLSLLGEEVSLRFFDSRLYEGVKVGNAGVEVPYVLQFRAERGRDYAAVIRQLNAELAAPRRESVQTLVYLLTHGEAQFPTAEVQLLASRAPIYGVYILPRGPLELGYLDALHRVHVIDDEAIAYGRRASRARQIISQVESDLDEAARSQVGARSHLGGGGKR
ncbi:hypothetical protein G6O69_29410 [Pseudenhygromyxa sp. WMMC2535]|uniref:vWA domain-containing protein n=1 Tax=Pseudenhygromyxa sp. WMMC2535 TaxID=2712867 RepID=UPI00155770B1|nr:vWA domain-containing protein [Pseudenhygromyxa sp. WMMC2535]NVB41981.1 hypothetical protein [Pseudenhygromyxa sp. WMMC2535]